MKQDNFNYFQIDYNSRETLLSSYLYHFHLSTLNLYITVGKRISNIIHKSLIFSLDYLVVTKLFLIFVTDKKRVLITIN